MNRSILILTGVFLMTIIFHRYIYQYIIRLDDDSSNITSITTTTTTTNDRMSSSSITGMKTPLSIVLKNTTTTKNPLLLLQQNQNQQQNNNNNNNQQQQQHEWKSPKVLIAQYGSYPSRTKKNTTYEEMLQLTSQANQEYALLWNYDYMILRGIPFPPPTSNSSSSYRIDRYIIDGKRVVVDETYYDTIDTTVGQRESLTTYSKVTILEIVMNDPMYRQYDVLVLLDADAMIYDYNRDIAQLIPRTKMLVAHRVWQYITTSITTNINIGITIWNLRHTMTSTVLNLWKKECIQRIQNHPKWRDDDQTPLQHILYKYYSRRQRRKLILAIRYEFYYHHATFIKHFKRQNSHSWNDINGQNNRIQPILHAIYEICTTYHKQLYDSNMCVQNN